MNQDGMSGFGTGLLFGAIIGLAVGLLYAPREGSQTREMLRERAEEVREKASEAYEKARGTASDIVKKSQKGFMRPEET